MAKDTKEQDTGLDAGDWLEMEEQTKREIKMAVIGKLLLDNNLKFIETKLKEYKKDAESKLQSRS